MSAVFLKLLNLSITASWLILAVILVRFLLKKAPKWISCVLWALVAVRLVCPFSLESALSLIPSSETIPSNIEMMQKPAIDSGITAINEAVNPAISHSFAPDPMTSANPLQIIIPVLSIVWIVGMAAMLLYALISYIRLKKSVGASVPVRDNILACDEVKSPFILGIIKPLIYVPSSMEGDAMDYVITHESAHIQRRDHWWKPFGYILLTVYWFNPLCWLAYVLLCRDIEMACDEKVIRDMEKDSVAEYSQALLNCSFPRRRIAVCPLAFGEVGVKERVKSVLNYKKPAFWIIVVAVIACVVVAVCFLTNPKNYSEEIQVNGQIYLRQENEVKTLPTDSYELGRLLGILHRTKEHPSEDFSATNLDAKYAGNMLYQSSRDASTIYLEDLSGFYIPFTVVESTPDEVTFEAEVLEIHDGFFLVAPEASWALNSADRIEVPMMSMNSAPEPRVGDIIEITCSGEILETYPARLSKVYGIKVAKKASTVTKWFDCLHGDEMVWDGRREINFDEFPGVTFRWYSEKLEAVTEKETITLYTGMPIWSVYFCDLNGDGKPEVCSSISLGSGIIDNRIIVADYANKAVYELSDRGHYDYILTCQNGQLLAEKRAYMQDEVLEAGPLVLRSVIGADSTAIPMLMIGQSESQNDTDIFTVGGVDGPESVTVNIRTDVCELYLEVLEDLWNVDPGLNGGISQIGIDLSGLTHLTVEEKESVMSDFASRHNLPYIAGTWEELCEQGYIDKDNLYWEDGLFFSIETNEDAVWNLPAIKEGDSVPELTAFNAHKWRSGLGAYFFGQCTAQKNADGTWSYTVGAEMIS